MNYRGRKHKSGMGAGQVAAAFLVTLLLVILMTGTRNSQITGMSLGEQIHQALFVAKDWD